MRPAAQRRLYVSLSAGVIVTAMILSASLTPALAADDAPPAQYVVALDAGHGGSANDADPSQLFDPGVTAPNGLLEKDLTLSVAQRLRALLQRDRVKVIMTRDSDTFVGIATREAAANDGGANLFVSIHFNYFGDPSVGGSLVLYPGDASQGFASTMAAALQTKLRPLAIGSNGTMLKADLWTHAQMPAVTVEAAYLTNPREAGLLTHGSTLDAIATAVDGGVLAQAPEIGTRKAQIQAYEKAHAAAPAVVAVKAASKLPLLPAGAVSVLVLAFVFRRRVAPVALPALALAIAAVAVAAQRTRRQPEWRNRRGIRRRRSRARPWEARRAA